MRKDKEKFKIIEETFDEERNSMYEKLTKTVSEVDAQKKKYDEMQHTLSAAREDILKLELENAKLKEQEETNGKNKAPATDFHSENRPLEEEPRKKGVENNTTKSHISRLSDNKWSLLGVMVLIV